MRDETDRKIINALQGGFPVCERPFKKAAAQLGLEEDELIARIDAMRQEGVLTRFGPLFNVDRMGGAFCLCAMKVPREEFDHVAGLVNGWREVAHNYEREHELNMWFVLATEQREDIERVARAIEAQTGHKVYLMPKREEFFIGLRVSL